MKRNKWFGMVLSVLVLLTALACPSCCGVLVPHLEQPYSNPPVTFRDSDLVGTWETHYMEWGIDRLILKGDGTFRQLYQDHTVENYVYETPWNEWWVERFPDGRARIHLQGARYYLAGIRVAEMDGMSHLGTTNQPDYWSESGPPSFDFYDPVAEEYLHMVGALVLNVRSDSSGKFILLHMWTDFDRGFAIIGGGSEEFRRTETQSPLRTPSAY